MPRCRAWMMSGRGRGPKREKAAFRPPVFPLRCFHSGRFSITLSGNGFHLGCGMDKQLHCFVARFKNRSLFLNIIGLPAPDHDWNGLLNVFGRRAVRSVFLVIRCDQNNRAENRFDPAARLTSLPSSCRSTGPAGRWFSPNHRAGRGFPHLSDRGPAAAPSAQGRGVSAPGRRNT